MLTDKSRYTRITNIVFLEDFLLKIKIMAMNDLTKIKDCDHSLLKGEVMTQYKPEGY